MDGFLFRRRRAGAFEEMDRARRERAERSLLEARLRALEDAATSMGRRLAEVESAAGRPEAPSREDYNIALWRVQDAAKKAAGDLAARDFALAATCIERCRNMDHGE